MNISVRKIASGNEVTIRVVPETDDDRAAFEALKGRVGSARFDNAGLHCDLVVTNGVKP